MYSLVGNEIGMNNYVGAKRLLHSSVILLFITYAIILPLCVFLRGEIAQVFFATPEEVEMMEKFMIWMIFKVFMSGNFWNFFAYFRAYGFQKMVSPWLILIIMCFGHPMCACFCFDFAFGLEILGAWISQLLITSAYVLFLFVRYFMIDWEEHTQRIFKQLNKKKYLEIA
jgi:Na+-driven multidrug efflux pump